MQNSGLGPEVLAPMRFSLRRRCRQLPIHFRPSVVFEHERWHAVETFASLSIFELDALLAYKMKLLIATRCASFDRERGKQGFRTLYQDTVDAAAEAASSALETGVAT